MYKKRYIKRKGGAGHYKDDYLTNPNNTIEVIEKGKKVKYIKDENGDIISDFIGEVRLDRAIVVNGRIYDVQNIFDWIVKNKNNRDPIDRDYILPNEIENIKKKYIEVFGKHKYKKELDKMNASPPKKRVAYDQYGNMVDQFPHPQYFVDANGENFFEYNVNINGDPIMLNYIVDRNGQHIMVEEPMDVPRPVRRRIPLGQLRPLPPRRTSSTQRTTQVTHVPRYTLHFDRPNNGFLVDNHNNPANFVTVDGDIVTPYLLDNNFFPINLAGDNINILRRRELEQYYPAIIQNSIIHTARYSPRTRQQANASAGVSPPASPRASPQNIQTVTRRQGRPAGNTVSARSSSPPAARRSSSQPATTNYPTNTRRGGRSRRRQQNP
jgi:hypothetical protein